MVAKAPAEPQQADPTRSGGAGINVSIMAQAPACSRSEGGEAYYLTSVKERSRRGRRRCSLDV